MTILAAHEGVLYADSGRVLNYHRWYSTLDNKGEKIFFSPCGRIALCSTGFVNAKEDHARIAQFFVGRIQAFLESQDFKDLVITPTQRREVGMADCVYLIMTAHGYYQYDADGYNYIMQFTELGETVVIGGAIHFVTAALSLGQNIIQAMELACSKNAHCRLPIRQYDIANLKPFEVAAKEEKKEGEEK